MENEEDVYVCPMCGERDYTLDYEMNCPGCQYPIGFNLGEGDDDDT